jgi:hypothetical protein
MEAYFDIVKTHAKEPTGKKTEWADTSKLCMMFVEFRPKDIIKYNLWNIANIYGGGDTALVIVHSGENKDLIMEVTKDWKNVRYEQLYESNVDVNEYSRLLTSVDFWNKFSKYEHVLVNQWDSYLFKRIPEKFFEYDYVGGPCGHYYINWHGNLMNICGMSCSCPRCLKGDHPFKSDNFDSFQNKFILLNGGFSLRKVSTTIDLCKKKPWRGEPEDVYFAISDLTRPSREEAKEFGIQVLKYDDPVGCHQVWMDHDLEYIQSLFK